MANGFWRMANGGWRYCGETVDSSLRGGCTATKQSPFIKVKARLEVLNKSIDFPDPKRCQLIFGLR